MSIKLDNSTMKEKKEWITIVFEEPEEDDEFGKLFNTGMPLGDIVWKMHGEIIEPHPEFGYEDMFSSPISQLGIPRELLEKHGLLDY